MNLTSNTVSCLCSIKTSANSVVESPKIDEIIRATFVDSNLAVIKCYYLVFRFESKNENIGFWILMVQVYMMMMCIM